MIKGMSRHYQRRYINGQKAYETYSALLVIRKMQVKTTVKGLETWLKQYSACLGSLKPRIQTLVPPKQTNKQTNKKTKTYSEKSLHTH
jgi:hypothetical protein